MKSTRKKIEFELRGAAQCAKNNGVKAGATISGAAAGSGAEAGASAGGAVSGSSAAWKPRESPEVQLLLLCARSRMTPEGEARVRALAGGALDWTYLLRLVMRHGMGPLLHYHTSRVCPAQVPPEIAQHLREFTEKSRAWNEYVAQEGARAYAVLRDAGIRAVAYRELTLGARLSYGPVTLRQMEAADFLIAPRDAARARQVLLDAGYSAPPHRGAGGELIDPPAYQWFEREGRPAAVLLYWTLVRSHYGITYDFERIAQRARPVKPGNVEVPGVCGEDLALFTSVHASLYLWHSMEWVCDVAEAANDATLNWDVAEDEARRIHAEKLLRLGIFLANDLVGAAIPAEVVQRATSDTAVRRVAPAVITRLLNSAPGTITSLHSSWFHFQMRDNARDRAAYVFRMFVTPTEADWRFVKLPRRAFFLYPWLRPVRVQWRLLQLGLLLPLQRRLGLRRELSGYTRTPMPVVERMLELAELQPGDVLYDVGCGDGRIVIEAARRYGVRSVGVDLDAERIAESRANARKAGVEGLVEFVQKDVMTLDLAAASVVTLYMPPRSHLKLRDKLRRELRSGARVIAHGTDLGEWSQVELAEDKGCPAAVYVWKV